MNRLLRVVSGLLVLVLLAQCAAFAETVDGEAALLLAGFQDEKGRDVDAAPFADGSDGTGMAFKKADHASVVMLLPDGAACRSVYLRLDARAATAVLQQMNAETHKYETVATLQNPGAEFVFRLSQAVSGKLRVTLKFSEKQRCTVTELQCYGAGELPKALHAWLSDQRDVDVLLLCETLDQADTALIATILASGRSLAVCAAAAGETPALQTADTLWQAGLRILPSVGEQKDATLALVGWLRIYRPMLLITGETQLQTATQAAAQAADSATEVEQAAQYGLWVLPDTCLTDGDVAAKLAAMGERSNDALRAQCAAAFSDALHADTALIPYPGTRDADGFLPDAEYLYENEQDGLWAYLSPTVQVQIVRYTQPDVPQLWYQVDLKFDPTQEQFKQHIYEKAAFEGQQTYPEKLAQTDRLVFGINGDYYPYRIGKAVDTGNIIRNRTVLYNIKNKNAGYPNLDTLALRDDGSLSVFAGSEITADELLLQGNVHDALSFGPYLVRDGQLRVYDGMSWDAHEPRMAIGMVAPGHYIIIMVEGKMPKGQEQGMDLNQIAQLMYAQGVTDAFNLDGGSTAVLLFMGKKLNRTGKASSVGKPRNQHELFGLGTSELTHTDSLTDDQ